MIVYLGYDTTEHLAYLAAVQSIRRYNKRVELQKLALAPLKNKGLYWRPTEMLRSRVLWDSISGATMATEFAISRFLIPVLQHDGFAVFMDCDVVASCDIEEIMASVDPRKAVSVVKHSYTSEHAHKMSGLPNVNYQRKNWSSVMVFNCAHPANRKLTLGHVNTLPGRELHRFCWLHDDEIGELPGQWNWLVGEQPKPAGWKIAHFTLGGPWIPSWEPHEHDEIWHEALRE